MSFLSMSEEAAELPESDCDTKQTLEMEILRLRNQVKELSDSLEEERRLRVEGETNAKTDVSRLMADNESLRSQIVSLSSDLNEADQQLQELIDGDESVEEQVTLKKEAYAAQKENTALQSRVETLEEQLEAAETEAAELRSTVSTQTRDLLIKSQEYKRALRELEQNRDDLASLMKELAMVKEFGVSGVSSGVSLESEEMPLESKEVSPVVSQKSKSPSLKSSELVSLKSPSLYSSELPLSKSTSLNSSELPSSKSPSSPSSKSPSLSSPQLPSRELIRSQKLEGLRRENASLQGMLQELRLQLLKLGRHQPVSGDAPDLESEGVQVEIQSEEDAKHAFRLASATVGRIAETFVSSGSDVVLREVGRLLLVQRQLAELGESLFLPLAEDQLLCVKRNNDQLIGRLNESNAAMQVMQERLRDAESMLALARDEAAVLRERHPEREMNRLMEAAAQEQATLARELETTRDALRKDEMRILKLETDSLGLQEEIERGERVLRQKEEEHASATRALREEVAAKERSLKLTREDLEEAEEDVEDLEKEVQRLKRKLEEVTEVRDKLRVDVQELSEDNDELVRELKDLNEKLKGLL